MIKQFTIITKDGSKWLRPVNLFNTQTIAWRNSIEKDLPYIGSHPEGTTLEESEVREVRQYRLRGTDYWFHPNDSEYKPHELDIRTAYTDAKSHDCHISPFRIHNVRPLVNQLIGEEISFSRFVEILNEIANGNQKIV